MTVTRVLIAGGGLSGLTAARRLSDNSINFQLIEARHRLGGRILVEPAASQAFESAAFNPCVDLGPSWFWPGQSCMAQLIEGLGLADSVYQQASEGLSVVEYRDGSIEKARGAASMAGSNRLDGGMQRLIDELASSVAQSGDIATGTQLLSLTQASQGITAHVSTGEEQRQIESEFVILAIPPRVVSQSISFTPELPCVNSGELASIPTWMAAHAKFVVTYDKPFWQADGLSGDAFSQVGPLVEIHDASPRTSDRYALFGFVGIDATQRMNHADDIKALAIEQLVRLFGPEAAQPQSVSLKDWAMDPFTCTAHDLKPSTAARSNSSIPVDEWNSSLLWAGTETATLDAHSNGYLEGAVEAGLRAADRVISKLR